ncbi:Domain of uncharacterised function DUF222 [Arthrobacter agilis]|uniref:HNH endonuclease signature motif containing protein n=1 Tax=Arthrobacter agilis TaxID=37921 RepID=UPI000F6FDEB3|nr:Domain of uncharacterised function DUF222 [Arthrobacter agilis]
MRSFATPQQLESMECHLTRQAVESDEDILRVLARRWESVLDQDGQEPSEKVLRARQGVFLRGRRHGLHMLEIGATDEQFEHLATVMNATANPRIGTTRPLDSDAAAGGGPGRVKMSVGDPEGPTRAQALLDGLVTACRIALTTAALPATGGHRPQVMVTIDYKDLISDIQSAGHVHQAGHGIFSGQLSARTIRRMACDADLIPLVLGSAGQVLDVGRAQRFFPPHLRRALVARDKGCAFPDCSIPASWCEAHHVNPWSRGGRTSIGNGVLLCSRHHHVIHQGAWAVETRRGIPWFRAPENTGRAGKARRNSYWQAGRIVREEQSDKQSGENDAGPG